MCRRKQKQQISYQDYHLPLKKHAPLFLACFAEKPFFSWALLSKELAAVVQQRRGSSGNSTSRQRLEMTQHVF